MKTARFCIPLALVGWMFLLPAAVAQAPFPVYTDRLVNGFQDWGWATRSYANTNPVHSGVDSISVTMGSYGGLQIWHSDLNSSLYSAISLWINGGTNGGQKLQVYGLAHVPGTNNAATTPRYSLGTLQTNTWQQFTIPLSALASANTNNFTGFVIQDRIGSGQPTFYVDDIQLNSAPAPSPVHLSLNATNAIRTADFRWFGVNTAIWDTNFDKAQTISTVSEMGTKLMRAPGGSLSDEYHWSTDTNLTNTWRWATSFANFVHVVTNVGAQAIITVNYGTGTSNEAAAWVAYANAWNTNTTPLGTDQYGKNWQNAAYWANIRGAAPLSSDDGKNFLRLSRSPPFGFKYWEIGNECYGTWETDSNIVAHEAYTYAMRAAGYFTLMKAVNPTIKVGIVASTGEDSNVNGNATHPATNSVTGGVHYGWTPVVLSTLKSLGVTPDFLVHHVYPQWTDPNNPQNSPDNDAALLQAAANWAPDAADLRAQITGYFGALGTNIELVCTENNSDAGAQGRQSTSLVNGLYYADSLARLMQTEFNAFVWWDLRNSTDTGGFFDATLYGWRTYGDLGMINGLSTKHPTFYAAKLMQYFVQAGERVLSPSSDYPLLSAYAARPASGAVNLLVLNKDTTTAFNGQVALSGFVPNNTAMFRSYGIPQDEAARTNGTAQAQNLATNSFAGVAGTFNYSFPPLSMTLFTLSPTAPSLAVLGPASPGGPLVLQLQGQPLVRYIIQNSSTLTTWTSVATNTLSSSTVNLTNPPSTGQPMTFWRAVWQP